ncbi:hypothetical protein C095_07575 [Fusobacterium necrophorum subsp. funduliforme B35]|uniref:Uncharacterized protein n=1 Tax=Fusobacterium necrophorum subsp. funduliforme B35 TaxID=1226633 RepID=A0A0B4EPN7_9FUSO|nr:hypothetical protein C095_07575 [Fusobacterium necrophorum subsp. funduliforme B35]
MELLRREGDSRGKYLGFLREDFAKYFYEISRKNS